MYYYHMIMGPKAPNSLDLCTFDIGNIRPDLRHYSTCEFEISVIRFFLIGGGEHI